MSTVGITYTMSTHIIIVYNVYSHKTNVDMRSQDENVFVTLLHVVTSLERIAPPVCILVLIFI